jgi:hypothetical protein
MFITRFEALAVAFSCSLMTAAICADDKPDPATARPRPDVVLNNAGIPKEVRAVCEENFSGYQCLRVAEREEKGTKVFRMTFFAPADTRTQHRTENGEQVTKLPLYDLEMTASGKVLEETYHWIDPKRLPKAVQASYEKWNPKGARGMAVISLTDVPKGEGRRFHVRIIMNQIKAYYASFKEDGSIISAEPAVVP